MLDRVAPLLLDWYDAQARDLPWRVKGQELPDPYRVWLSEVMLQQTTTAAVAPYFAKFTAKWPDVIALAAAPEADVMAAWAGLGYYSRARNLVKCAGIVAEMGGFPDDEAELLKLPGVGAYTAAAITAIAFGKRAVVVDANVERVVSRLFAIEQPLPASREQIRQQTDAITPDARAGDFAQAMMDIGATICTSCDAKCLLCPVQKICEGRASGDPLRLPKKAPKKPKPRRTGTAFWIARNNTGAGNNTGEDAGSAEVWLVTRAGKGMLGGMRSLPDDAWSARGDGHGAPPISGAWKAGGVVRHSFTHFDIELGVVIYAGDDPLNLSDGEWWPVDGLEDAGLPTLFAKAAQLVLARS